MQYEKQLQEKCIRTTVEIAAEAKNRTWAGKYTNLPSNPKLLSFSAWLLPYPVPSQCLRLWESTDVYRSFPNAFSTFPGIVYVQISPGTTCLKHFIAPAQLKVVGVSYDLP